MQQHLRELITQLDVFTRGGLHLETRQHHSSIASSNTQLFGQHWLRKIALKRLSNKSFIRTQTAWQQHQRDNSTSLLLL